MQTLTWVTTITETTGVGGFALANSAAILSLVGGTAEDASKYTRQMQQITLALNDPFLIPLFDFQGTATGIDIKKVVKTGILPVIDTAYCPQGTGHRHDWRRDSNAPDGGIQICSKRIRREISIVLSTHSSVHRRAFSSKEPISEWAQVDVLLEALK